MLGETVGAEVSVEITMTVVFDPDWLGYDTSVFQAVEELQDRIRTMRSIKKVTFGGEYSR